MRPRGVSIEPPRFFSLIGVLIITGGLLAFLFHDTDATQVEIAGPGELAPGRSAAFTVLVAIPPGQHVPVAGRTVILEDGRGVLESATCWGDRDCIGGIRSSERSAGTIVGVERIDATAPTHGRYFVRVEGYGRSAATGYGQEVEPERDLRAPDLEDEEGRAGQGEGYGLPDQAVVLQFGFELDGTALEPGRYHLTFLVETGSRAMGAISGPRHTLLVPAD